MLHIKKYTSRAYVSRIIILSLDVVSTFISFFLATALRFNFQISDDVFAVLPTTLLAVLVTRIVFFRYFKTYSGIIRYTGMQDAKRVLYSIAGGSVIFSIFSIFIGHIRDTFFFPISVVIIDFFIALFLCISYRLVIKQLYNKIMFRNIPSPKTNRYATVVFGAGQGGLITKRAIDEDGATDMKVVAFMDDNAGVQGKFMDGVKIYHTAQEFRDVVEKHNVKRAIISMQVLSPQRKQEFIDLCLECDVTVMAVPAVSKWLGGELNVNQIRNVNISDLLERDPIVLDMENIGNQINGRTVMITGAAGSIGSEMVRQLTRFAPQKLILIDQAESPLVELQLEVEETLQFRRAVPIVADVSSLKRMEHIFKAHRPDIIFHAAAYKHVPMMEHNVYEAIKVNVQGTRTLADLAVKYNVKKFVMVSTDKAVNPTNIMGASKRLAEVYAQSLSNHLADTATGTRFITTRFGNVLGSNGSVIPRFKKQIEAGGPVTVTNPDITRYFMTIPEACQLVLEAGAMGKGGEIFIFDMGKSIKIVDLARKMIKLSGFVPDRDIPIVFTGLRPGEKIEEELLNKSENIIPTHHHKIMVAKVRQYPFDKVREKTDQLIGLMEGNDEMAIVRTMKLMLPEFISNNSVFNVIDQELASELHTHHEN
ncbi:NDP-sugar epimerase, includes UDP-GlcNAc-inverting 4,6-dehydratase FlaA1 and capsular polysaccharide biosynthesis protein EpsC [Flexibacter flexilis DSM 6793]|uniref:NDP-sugar epimerase, includes UDP-GlcNAc-inverting 4,6-dehydratase FlaA1 and capsular polysaccharide biosynthesis protein EpsC n=1 Tax=Flexibacter flexilis DSM 6793 TaxID=927664 RepID=A0A1I1I887_9BACT|nr:nucleoside-diphosphate sugar epimerase/dehydratase [Flexibacter flexilis]SFC32032.1 NDP-sugar epimerase, includes UDP-GlcNAc-inverting 4,6-dehydratase FlaA1 and capsular polysaccharide biosynthesis protein EpsC [Flexibacter flexilis DSM 6793]